MRTVLKANPFYTEAWYTLFKQEPQDLMGATKMVDEVGRPCRTAWASENSGKRANTFPL